MQATNKPIKLTLSSLRVVCAAYGQRYMSTNTILWGAI